MPATFSSRWVAGTATVGVELHQYRHGDQLDRHPEFQRGRPLTGGYDTAAGATIEFAGGSFTMGVPPVISGSGICEFTGATLTLTQNVPPNLVLAGGNLVLGPAFQNAAGSPT